jgi:hypothetical protein
MRQLLKHAAIVDACGNCWGMRQLLKHAAIVDACGNCGCAGMYVVTMPQQLVQACVLMLVGNNRSKQGIEPRTLCPAF